jgi:hypothetical protein
MAGDGQEPCQVCLVGVVDRADTLTSTPVLRQWCAT